MLDFKKTFKNHKSIFLYGKTKSGKTTSILNYVKENNKDYSYTCIQELKNEKDFISLLESQNVYKMFFNNNKNYEKYIIIDNIDYLNNNEKKVIGIIIKFFKQKLHLKYENVFIIFIGSNLKDKKVQELMNHTSLQYECTSDYDNDYDKIVKEITRDFLNDNIKNNKNMCDKNIISLCYHENIIHILNNDLNLYQSFLKNFCNGDYYDRMSFKKQLLQLNEITFYLKLIINSYLFENIDKKSVPLSKINFTKILTKFSNEYSNYNFVIQLCNNMKCQKEELYLNLDQIYKKHLTLQEYKRIKKLFT